MSFDRSEGYSHEISATATGDFGQHNRGIGNPPLKIFSSPLDIKQRGLSNPQIPNNFYIRLDTKTNPHSPDSQHDAANRESSTFKNDTSHDYRFISDNTVYNPPSYYPQTLHTGQNDTHENVSEGFGEKLLTAEDSYNHTGPPSFSKSGYPIQMKKGGSYEYRTINYGSSRGNSEQNRGQDLNSHRNSTDLQSRRGGSRSKNRRESTPEPRETDLMKVVQESLKYATKCKIHNQNYSLYNPHNKQLCCIECLYTNPKNSHKKLQVLSLKAAYSIISESNRQYKVEAREKVAILEDNIKACMQNTNIIQLTHDALTANIRKEFNELFEELKRRELYLIESISTIMEGEIRRQREKVNDFEFLKNCFKDAREVDPQQSFELGVHFFAVYNMLKNTMKPFEIQAPLYTSEDFNLLDFSTRTLVKSEILNFGRILNRSPQKKKLLKTSAKKRSGSGSRITKRENSPLKFNQRMKTPEINRGRNARSPISPLDKLRAKARLGTSASSGKIIQKGEVFAYTETDVHPREHMPEIGLSSAGKRARKQNSNPVGDFEHLMYRRQSEASPISSRRSPSDSHRRGQKLNVISEENTRHPFNEPGLHRSIDLINNMFLFHDSAILTNDMRNSDVHQILPPNIKHTKLLYRLTNDGASSLAFHEKCDHHGPCIVVVKSDNQFVFGYYTPISFVSEEKYNTCEDCFIFSLRNPYYDKVMKFPIKNDKKFIALYQSSKSPCLGSTLQNKQDLWIQFDNLPSSCSVIGYAYQLPPGVEGTRALAGQYTGWNIQEIEVFKLFFQ